MGRYCSERRFWVSQRVVISNLSQKPGALDKINFIFCHLTETCRAIENGANSLAEGFLFGVAALLILGETWRSSRSQSKRRDSIDEQLEDLSSKLQEMTTRVDSLTGQYEDRWLEETLRYVISCLYAVHGLKTWLLSQGMTNWHAY